MDYFVSGPFIAVIIVIIILRLVTRHLKKKTTILQEDTDLVISQVATLLTDEMDTPFHDFFEGKDLDYSFDSLKIIDSYLDEIRKKKHELSDEQYTKVVMRCGIYCGEVIKKHSKNSRRWIVYEDFMARNPEFKDKFPMSVANGVALFAEPDNFSFPLAKVVKYLENGPEDSLYFFAQVVSSGPIS